ncbi:MAG: hypothetical protein WC551_08125 [Patescibacteria group bacterium]
MKYKIMKFTTSLPAIPGVKQVCVKVESVLSFLPKVSEFIPCKRS